jgi:hypothetical protein
MTTTANDPGKKPAGSIKKRDKDISGAAATLGMGA